MKKPLVIALVAAVLIAIMAVVLFSSKEKESTSETPLAEEKVPDSFFDIPDVGEEPTNVVIEEEPEVPTVMDIRAAIEDADEEAETKFLTTAQKRELKSATIGGGEARPRAERTFAIDWSTTDFSSALPELPNEAPIYLLDRPTDEKVFDVVRELADDMGLTGAVLRSNRQKYSVADIAKGEYYMTYDMYHLGFDASVMNAPLEGTVKDTLEGWGVLGFANKEIDATDSKGNTWKRYQPALELPVLTMQRDMDDEFQPEKMIGEVMAEVTGKNITRVIARFPGILPKESMNLLDTEGMTAALENGEFKMGDVILQYPGALPLEDKRSFFEASREDAVSIAEGEISEVKCGYFLEDDEVLQALLSPACMAEGKGKMDGKSVLFRVLFPAVQ